MHFDVSTRFGIIGGTLFSVLPLFSFEALWETVVMAVVGATVSFGVSLVMKWLVKWVKK